jgi:hypothetical protein
LLQPLILVEKKSSRYMPPHPHRDLFCMEPCIPYGEKWLSHTETDAENDCTNKTKLPPQADVWQN